MNPPNRRHALARGFALFLGGLITLNLIGEIRTPGLDQNLWLVDLPMPRPIGLVLLALAGVGLVAWGIRPNLAQGTRTPTAVILTGIAITAAWNSVNFYRVWDSGAIDPALPMPLSVIWMVIFAWLAWEVQRPQSTSSEHQLRWIVAALAVSVLALPLLLIFFFGNTDYRRPVDAAVVFGSRVYDDGRPSASLEARVRTAVDVYQEGLTPILIMSGGIPPNGIDESLVMRDLAIELGVPPEAIVTDSGGNNSDLTVEYTIRFVEDTGADSIAAVSHFYHLPRIQLAFQSRGLDVITVPANDYQRIAKTPLSVIREIPAFWIYYLKATFG